MNRKLPPLNQLRAFEAAARYLSFKDAANELNVTHSAVSQQIRALEDHLGYQLFHRSPGGVQLTSSARELAQNLTGAFDQMDLAINQFRASELMGKLTVSVVPWHGYRYLVPNLDRFGERYPDIELDLHFSYEAVDFEVHGVDAAMRHGLGQWPGLEAYRINHDVVIPVTSPEVAART